MTSSLLSHSFLTQAVLNPKRERRCSWPWKYSRSGVYRPPKPTASSMKKTLGRRPSEKSLPPQHNFLHDIESVLWWLIVWLILHRAAGRDSHFVKNLFSGGWIPSADRLMSCINDTYFLDKAKGLGLLSDTCDTVRYNIFAKFKDLRDSQDKSQYGEVYSSVLELCDFAIQLPNPPRLNPRQHPPASPPPLAPSTPQTSSLKRKHKEEEQCTPDDEDEHSQSDGQPLKAKPKRLRTS